jgi:hypothetical protein
MSKLTNEQSSGAMTVKYGVTKLAKNSAEKLIQAKPPTSSSSSTTTSQKGK